MFQARNDDTTRVSKGKGIAQENTPLISSSSNDLADCDPSSHGPSKPRRPWPTSCGCLAYGASGIMTILIVGFLVFWFLWLPAQEGLMGTPAAIVPSIDGAIKAAARLHYSRPNNTESYQEPKVLIVGAGAAGMHAAYLFEHLGIEYQVLGAYQDFGGRIRQMEDFINLPLDMGAEWIHVDTKVLEDLLLPDHSSSDAPETFRMETIDYQPQTWRVYSEGKWYNRDWMSQLYKEHKFYDSTWYAYHKEYIYKHIAHRVHLNTVVETIDYGGDSIVQEMRTTNQGVKITTKDGRTFTGTHALVTTSVATLQHQLMSFDPPLTLEKQRQFDAVPSSPALKVWFEFETRFYPDIVIVGDLWSTWQEESNQYSFLDGVYEKPTERNVLLLFNTGAVAESNVQLEDEVLVQAFGPT